MQAAEVRLEKTGKRYGDQWVVRDVSLHIPRGEFFTFLGPSGCGKTTLLRIIAGFVSADEGWIFLDGQAVNQVPPWRRDVGMVFQNYALWPHLTVFENVAFGLRERRVARAELGRRVTTALEQVDLAAVAGRRPSQLSGGQQQRVALARTLVIQPRLLLLDEPLSNLDAKLRVEMRLELLKLQRDLGLTTVYVTHDQEEALAMSTRIAVINQGKVIQEGPPREIYEQPIDDFVAGFIGQSNLIAGTIDGVLGDTVVVALEAGVKIAIPRPKAAQPVMTGEKVTLSVRPEAVEIGAPGVGSFTGNNNFSGEIIAAAYQGAFVEYEVAALGKSFKARVAKPQGKPLYQRGDSVELNFSADEVAILARGAGS